MSSVWDVIIVGGGPAGATAALYTARANLKTLVVDKGVRSGALGITVKIANYPGIPGELTGAELVERMQKQAASFGAEFRKGRVSGTDLGGETKKIFLADGEVLEGRAVIVTTGAMGKSNALPGEKELLGRGVSYCATCDAAFFKGRDVLVTGSTPEATEEAEFLTRFARKVYVVTPKRELPGETEALRSNAAVEILTGRRLKRIEGNGKVSGVVLEGKPEKSLAVDGVFLFGQGNKPISDYARGQLELSPAGCVKVNREQATSIPGVFGAGDVLCNDVQQAVVAAGQGAIAALSADKFLNKRDRVAKDYK